MKPGNVDQASVPPSQAKNEGQPGLHMTEKEGGHLMTGTD